MRGNQRSESYIPKGLDHIVCAIKRMKPCFVERWCIPDIMESGMIEELCSRINMAGFFGRKKSLNFFFNFFKKLVCQKIVFMIFGHVALPTCLYRGCSPNKKTRHLGLDE